jgi:SAM-dependent methyltransferase
MSPLTIPPALQAPLDDVSSSLRRFYVDEFQLRHAPALLPGRAVLDVGGTRLHKRGVFNADALAGRVTYLNLLADKAPHVLADAAALPFAPALFDVVICSELMEHIPQPQPVLAEVFRALRPGGTLLINVPFLFRLHGDPYDFARYTDTWWQMTLARTGFTDITIERQGAFWSVLVDMLREWLHQQHKQKRLRYTGRVLRPLMARLKRRALHQDSQPQVRQHPIFGSYTTGFGILCRKPPAPPPD